MQFVLIIIIIIVQYSRQESSETGLDSMITIFTQCPSSSDDHTEAPRPLLAEIRNELSRTQTCLPVPFNLAPDRVNITGRKRDEFLNLSIIQSLFQIRNSNAIASAGNLFVDFLQFDLPIRVRVRVRFRA